MSRVRRASQAAAERREGEEEFLPPPMDDDSDDDEDAPAWEDETTLEMMVTKRHRLRGDFQRIFLVTDATIKTLDPATREATNAWGFDKFVRAAVDAQHRTRFNFVIKAKLGTQTMTFTAPSTEECETIVGELNRSREPDLDDCEHGWLLKKHPRGNKFQRRFFVLQGKILKYYKSDSNFSQQKHPISCASLRAVKIPSEQRAAAGRGFDLVFIDRRYTLIEEDTVQSRRFGQLLRSLKPAAQQGNALKDSSGAKLLVMECEHCGALNAVKANIVEAARKKGKQLPCSKCSTMLDPGHATEQKAVQVSTVKCPWCAAWLQYPKGSKEILCSSCGKKLQLSTGEEDGPKTGNAKREADLRGLIAELRARIKELEGECESDDIIIGGQRDEISKLKRDLEIHHSSATTKTTKRKGGRTRRGFDAMQM